MKLSKLEEDGTRIQKVFKGAKTEKPDALVEIKQEIESIKNILNQILQKLNEKS